MERIDPQGGEKGREEREKEGASLITGYHDVAAGDDDAARPAIDDDVTRTATDDVARLDAHDDAAWSAAHDDATAYAAAAWNGCSWYPHAGQRSC